MWRVAFLLLLPLSAWAGPWTRDPGHFYLSASYQRISAASIFGPDFKLTGIPPYEQHVVGFYGEVGVIQRWLTVSVDGTLYRRALQAPISGGGVGDWRVGLWTGLVDKPVRFTFAMLLGLPIGNPNLTLSTGDGEWDVEWRASLGYSFGGVRRWPLIHYLVAEAGYWVRSAFADAFTYKLELGVQFPWKFVDRFWLIGRLTGVESFASQKEVSLNPTGLGNGVTYTSPGVELYGRIWRGLGASVGGESAFRARAVPGGAQLKVGVSYQW